jgi:tight adherence protein C
MITANIPWLIISALFLSLFLFSIGVAQFIIARKKRHTMVEKIRGGVNAGGNILGEIPLTIERPRKSGFILDLLRKLGTSTVSEDMKDVSNMRLRFLRAGIRHEHALSIFWGLKIFLSMVTTTIFIALRLLVFKLISYELTVMIAVVVAFIGFYLPDIWLRLKADKRKENMLNALPNALDLLVVCVEAGMGLDSAINRVAEESKGSSPVLSDELHFMTLELRAGKNRRDALRNLALRINLDEINSLVTLLIETEKFGTSMAEALRVYSESFRIQRHQRAEEVAAKLPVKLLIPLGLFIFPALFVVILGPAFISIYRALGVDL